MADPAADLALGPGGAQAARRALVVAAVGVVAASRLADGAATWAVAGMVAAALLLGALQVFGTADPAARAAGVPVESLLLPAVLGFAAVGTLRLVPVGGALVLALGAVWFAFDRLVGLEGRLVAQPRGPAEVDQTRVLVASTAVAFLAFVGTAALVPGGLPEPRAAGTPAILGERELVLLAGVDALLAGIIGYRIAALRTASLRGALASALTYGAVIAISAAAIRAMDIPRLVGPALLVLVFFLWDAFHAPPTGRRRDPRWLGQVALLVLLGAAVLAWNLALR